MAIGEVFAAQVECLAPGGQGVVRLEGRRVFMRFTAPGDRVVGRITGEKKHWAEAELVELTEASPQRVEPTCPLYGRCGGCSLQHISYEAQLPAKKAMLLDTLRHIGGIEPPPLSVTGSEPWEYRNRVSFHGIRTNRGPRAGFKARGSAEIIPIPDCPVSDAGIRSLLQSGNLVPPAGQDRFTLYSNGPVLLGNGVSRGTVTLAGRPVTLDADCFFQSNAALLEKCAADLRSIAEEAAAVSSLPMADLYAGVGTFSVILGDLFPGADLVEENPLAMELARYNLRGLPCRFFRRTDEQWVRSRRSSASGSREPYSFIIADPPRQGLSRSLALWLAEAGPPVLAYLSCEPASLARDCRIFARAYTISKLYLYDFYPQTAHIECLAVLLRRKNGDS
jgi:23S rRNA (uracil1939-C5)-methyltransferase